MKNTVPADETTEQLHLQAGRRAPYTQVGDWVLLAPIRPQARLLYWALSAHINSSREDTAVWPTQDVLAEMLGYSDGRKVRPLLAELEAIDAITIRKSRRLVGGLRRERSIYVVHQSPPEGYEGHESLRDFYAARKARIEAARVACDGPAGTHNDTEQAPGGRNEPPGACGVEPKPQGAEMSPLVGGRNGPPNKTKGNETERGGHPAAPRTPAELNSGRLSEVVTDQRKLVRNQQTARAKLSAPGESDRAGNDESTSSGWVPPAGAVVGGDGAQLEPVSSRQAALAAAAEARARGTVRNSARKSALDSPRRALGRAGEQFPTRDVFVPQRAK
ncbi:hypothetical protein [Nocardia paucivorans]|uniref:hypothetical protein n=1 Tax=Nocardia paucivorans TaxID=114259 RepID=UPI00031ECB51|nr:hypothetical protein [Nocardia paucivorans]